MAVEVMISEEEISKRISELGAKITNDYAGEELVVVGVLNGAFMFVADLIRKINVPVRLEFMAVASYSGTESTGEIKVNLDLKESIRGKNVLVVEDIVDTGLTIKTLRGILQQKGPKSLRLASLLYKPARNIHKVEIDYLAFEIEDRFVIGYGLDFDGKYRELPYIGVYSHG
ncbi:hypoxanthine phosphoribosyltransferase [Bacteriovorax sp. BSW11_IV]|uniref:hypoxanthine phosphoribosyltransferase n=1 Tax=Bacteriovorax sp. BSW11_IV TaxID=1353529 RepID=UPI00038A2464|nr:hypoxanthine phosphoribosyltransferase [Bacteriovorax sp. BSW11_IV]EQC46748.1 hypoxanthine phosphoribosyltransferase [Bacteriovorax sp. BSW11_IV]